MSEFSIYLKVGMTSIVLQLIEKGVVGKKFSLKDPVAAIKHISRDLSCKNQIELADGQQRTPIEVQRAYLKLAQQHLTPEERTPVVEDVLEKWQYVLDNLEIDPMRLSQHLDWVIKKKLMEAYRKRHGYAWTDAHVQMLDLQYHDIRPDKGLYIRLLKKRTCETVGQPRRDSACDALSARGYPCIFSRHLSTEVPEAYL